MDLVLPHPPELVPLGRGDFGEAVRHVDEPFAGVDPITVQEIQSILRRLREQKGIAILLTDHNVRETLTITDRSYIIAAGKILRHGPPAALVRDEVVRRTYLGEAFSMPELEGAP